MTRKMQINYDTDTSFAFDLIRQAAWARNLEVIDHSRRVYSVRNAAGATANFARSMPGTTPVFVQQCMADKTISKRMLAASGVRVAQGRSFPSMQKKAAWEYAQTLGGPFVVKPVSGEGGKGVTTNITTQAQFNLAWDKVLNHSAYGTRAGILIESFITGGDHRIVVVGDKVVAALRKWPLYLVGDGVSTIPQLIELKRQARKLNAFTKKKKFEITPTVRQTMKEKGLTDDLVLPKGKYVELDTVGNLAAGGESENIPVENIHPGFIKAALAARACMDGIDICGLDMLAEDLTRDPEGQSWAVCELNMNSDIGLNHFPVKGDPVDTAGAYIEYYFPASAKFLDRPQTAGAVVPLEAPLSNLLYNRLTEACVLRMLSGGVQRVSADEAYLVFSGPPVSVRCMLEAMQDSPDFAALQIGESHDVDVADLPEVTRPFDRALKKS